MAVESIFFLENMAVKAQEHKTRPREQSNFNLTRPLPVQVCIASARTGPCPGSRIYKALITI